MTVKTITVTEEAYNFLKKAKNENESFSEVIIRITNRNRFDLKKYAGVLSEKRADELKTLAKKTREDVSRDIERRIKDVRSR